MTESWSNDRETFQYDSLGELMDSHSELSVGDTVYVGTAIVPYVSRYVFTDRILESMSDGAYDEVGEYAEDWPKITNEEQKILEKMIADFIEKHSPIKFYNVVDIKEYTITLEDINE